MYTFGKKRQKKRDPFFKTDPDTISASLLVLNLKVQKWEMMKNKFFVLNLFFRKFYILISLRSEHLLNCT